MHLLFTAAVAGVTAGATLGTIFIGGRGVIETSVACRGFIIVAPNIAGGTGRTLEGDGIAGTAAVPLTAPLLLADALSATVAATLSAA